MQKAPPPRCCAPPPSAARHVQGPEYAPPSNGPAVKGLRAPQGVPPPVAPRRLGNCAKLDRRLMGVANPWDEVPLIMTPVSNNVRLLVCHPGGHEFSVTDFSHEFQSRIPTRSQFVTEGAGGVTSEI